MNDINSTERDRRVKEEEKKKRVEEKRAAREEEQRKYFKYLENKETYFDEVYKNDISKPIVRNLYVYNIAEVENILDKDLCEFTHEDVINLLNSIVTSSWNKKSDIFSFINQYCTWCISKGVSSVNPTLGLSRDNLIKVNKRVLKNKLHTKNETYDTIDLMLNFGDETIFTCLTLLLARYGLWGDSLNEIFNLRECDIDRENLLINVVDRESNKLIRRVEIDNRLLEYIDLSIDTIEYINPFKGISHFTGGENNLVIKYLEESNKDRENKEYIYNRFTNLVTRINEKYKEQGINDKFKRPVLSEYYNSYKLERLLMMRKHKVLTTKDFQNLLKELDKDASIGKYNTLVKLYENATGDKVFPAIVIAEETSDRNKEKRSDKTKEIIGEYEAKSRENHPETVLDIMKKLGWI